MQPIDWMESGQSFVSSQPRPAKGGRRWSYFPVLPRPDDGNCWPLSLFPRWYHEVWSPHSGSPVMSVSMRSTSGIEWAIKALLRAVWRVLMCPCADVQQLHPSADSQHGDMGLVQNAAERRWVRGDLAPRRLLRARCARVLRSATQRHPLLRWKRPLRGVRSFRTASLPYRQSGGEWERPPHPQWRECRSSGVFVIADTYPSFRGQIRLHWRRCYLW